MNTNAKKRVDGSKKHRKNKVKLAFKFLIPVILIIFVSISSVGVLGYFTVRSEMLDLMNDMTMEKVNEVKKQISERERYIEITKQGFNEYLLMATKAAANVLEYTPEDKINDKLEKLAKEIGVPEIHITDENGVLKWGNMSQLFGYDFDSSEQSRPFMEALENKNYQVVQEPMKRGLDGKLFQYITVARQDKPGIVQIGLEPKRMEKILSSLDIKTFSKSLEFGDGGYIVILDTEGITLSYQSEELIGADVTEYEWGKEVVSKKQGSRVFNFEGEEKVISYSTIDDKYIVCAIIPTSEYVGRAKGVVGSSILSIIIALILSTVFILLLMSKLITKRIRKLLEVMEEVGNGNLDVQIKDKSNDEVSLLNKSFKDMVDNLKNMVSNINISSEKLNKTSNGLAQAAEQTAAAGQQIASSINEIAGGANNQVEEIHESMSQLSSLESTIGQLNGSTKDIEEQAKTIKKRNNEGINAINDLKVKFGNNKKASKTVGKKIHMLSNKSNQIGDITESITSIAEQTSLLALNASIEAARAGDAGKGFAVVAHEIRNLADDASQAANNINIIISNIKEDVDESVKAMEEAGVYIQETNKGLDNTVSVFNDLSNANDIIIDLIDNLNTVKEQLNVKKENVSTSIDNIASVSEETAASTEEISATTEEQAATYEEINSSAKQLKQISDELTELINMFKIEE